MIKKADFYGENTLSIPKNQKKECKNEFIR
jgi:hypothetical protein